jgi:hypothetical protein
MIPADIDLVNGDLLQFLEIQFAVFAGQISHLDALDDIPVRGKVSGKHRQSSYIWQDREHIVKEPCCM